jgi:hypothetical protein
MQLVELVSLLLLGSLKMSGSLAVSSREKTAGKFRVFDCLVARCLYRINSRIEHRKNQHDRNLNIQFADIHFSLTDNVF